MGGGFLTPVMMRYRDLVFNMRELYFLKALLYSKQMQDSFGEYGPQGLTTDEILRAREARMMRAYPRAIPEASVPGPAPGAVVAPATERDWVLLSTAQGKSAGNDSSGDLTLIFDNRTILILLIMIFILVLIIRQESRLMSQLLVDIHKYIAANIRPK